MALVSGSARSCRRGFEAADARRLVVAHQDERRTSLTFTRDEWEAFVKGVKNGEFDPS